MSFDLNNLAVKVVELINGKQTDALYNLAGSSLKRKLTAANWKTMFDARLYPLIPLPPPVLKTQEESTATFEVGDYYLQIAVNKKGELDELRIEPGKKALDLNLQTDNGLITDLDKTVDQVIRPYFKQTDSIGLSVAIFCDDNVHFYNYGETEIGNNNLPSRDTVFEIGSVTKTFVGILLGVAVVKNLLQLDTAIAGYLPESVARNPFFKKINFRHLANHTSGLPRVPDDLLEVNDDPEQPYINYSKRNLFDYLAEFSDGPEPGTVYNYSNLGFGLLGVLLERVFNEKLESLIYKHISTPLQLDNTVFNPDEDIEAAQGYNELEQPVPMWEFKSLKAAGGIKSTIADLIGFGIGQLSCENELLARAINLSHHITFSDGHNFVGLGWHHADDSDTLVFHAGATGGFRSGIYFDKKKRIVVTMLANGVNSMDSFAISLLKEVRQQQESMVSVSE